MWTLDLVEIAVLQGRLHTLLHVLQHSLDQRAVLVNATLSQLREDAIGRSQSLLGDLGNQADHFTGSAALGQINAVVAGSRREGAPDERSDRTPGISRMNRQGPATRTRRSAGTRTSGVGGGAATNRCRYPDDSGPSRARFPPDRRAGQLAPPSWARPAR